MYDTSLDLIANMIDTAIVQAAVHVSASLYARIDATLEASR